MAVRTVRNANVDTDLTTIALSGLDSTAGMVVQTATDTFTKRTLTAANGVGITDPTGAGGNPTFAINPAKVQQFVATYAALTALVTATGLIDNGVYCTYGRTAEEDGGFGFWRYDSGSSATANSGTILAIDGGGAGRFFRLFDPAEPVNAQWFGYKVGGGTSDATANTTALQAALNAYYWVQLPAGTAYINAITHTIVNRLSGAGTAANGTKLVLANSANSRAFIASSLTDMMYEDFAVDMNFANNVGSGAHDAFRLETCTKPVFRNIRVTGAQGLFSGSPVGGGFSLLNGSGARFYDCEATLCFDGLQSTGHTDCVVVGGYYNTNRRFGIVMGTASHRAKFYDVVANGNSTTDSSGGNWSLQDSDDCVAHTLTLNDAVLAFGGLVSGSDRFRGFDITANGNGLDGFGPYDSIDCRVDGFTSSDNAVRGMTIDTSSHMARFTNGYCFGNDDMDVSVFRSANVVVQDANFLTGRVHEAAVAQSAAINAAGSGYTNGTFLCTMDGGTIGPLGRPSFNVTVSGGAVTAVSALVNTGEVWTLPTNPVTVTGLAAGSGATFNMTWLGANQQTATKVTFRGGGDGASLELAVDPLTGGSATSAAVFEGFRGTVTDTTNAAVYAAIASPLVVEKGTARILFKLIGANMNSTADQQFTKVGTFTSWTPVSNGAYKLVNPSISLSTAAGGVYSAASKGGDQLVASSQTYSTAGTVGTSSQAMTGSSLGNGVRTETPYLSLTTGQGVAATADIYIFGTPLS